MVHAVIALPLFVLCWHCHAACEVAMESDDTVTLVVQGGGCFRSDAQREALAAQLKQAVNSMESNSSRPLQRKSTAEQLNGFGDLRRQANHLSPAPPVYYGQR